MKTTEFNGIPGCWLQIAEDTFVHPQLKDLDGNLCEYTLDEASLTQKGYDTKRHPTGFKEVSKEEFDILIEKTPFIEEYKGDLSTYYIYEDEVVAVVKWFGGDTENFYIKA